MTNTKDSPSNRNYSLTIQLNFLSQNDLQRLNFAMKIITCLIKSNFHEFYHLDWKLGKMWKHIGKTSNKCSFNKISPEYYGMQAPPCSEVSWISQWLNLQKVYFNMFSFFRNYSNLATDVSCLPNNHFSWNFTEF